MRIGQQVVSGGNKYTFNLPNGVNNLVIFDMHNDSPYNAGISFGRDTGITNCDYFTSPHGILTGIMPPSIDKRTIGGARWNGIIYVYTEIPIGGGGTTNLASAPASSITVLGYQAGYQPIGQVALNRMQTTANTVTTAGNVSATAITNDGNAAGTSIVEATQVGGPGSNISILNDGTVSIADYASLLRHVLMQIIPGQSGSNPSIIMLANTNQLMEILGNLFIEGASLHLNNRSIISINDASGSQGNILTVDSIGNTILQAHSTNDKIVFWDKNGVVTGTIDNNSCFNIVGVTQQVNGTSGTMFVIEGWTGAVKIVIVLQNGYKNSNVTGNKIALKNPFTSTAKIDNIGCGGLQFLASNSAQSCTVMTGFGTGSGAGTSTTATQMNTLNIGSVGPFDTVADAGSYASTHTGMCTLIGQ